MPSSWGRRHGLPGYDEFRIGMTYRDALELVRVTDKYRYSRRGSVLGFMHELKLELYEQAVERGMIVGEIAEVDGEEGIAEPQKKRKAG